MNKKKPEKENNIVSFPSKLSSIEKEIEAIVFAAAEPLNIETIESKISKKADVEKILLKIQNEYSDRGINLVCISKKWSFRTSPNLSNLMVQEKTVEKKLSRAAIETLAIIVYHQPVTRAEIEEIRGVAFGTNTLEILMELNWVKPGGRKDVPGKPIQYITTDDFLSHFNLQKLSDLPTVDELGAAGLIDSTNSLWFWQQNRKEPMPAQQVEIVHQTEISCSKGHNTHYMKIKEVYDTYGYKEPGRAVCECCGTTYLLSEPTLEE